MRGFNNYYINQEQESDDAACSGLDPAEYLNDLWEPEEWNTEEVAIDEMDENPQTEDRKTE